ncbi:MAG: hypothetical protein SVZ03_01260 [Spirochaetota bacterium]|nr:hypothetical protein [Spirochaetota bacterium]
MKNKTKRHFPFGLFFVNLLILIIMSALILMSYFYFIGKSRITEIENDTRNYSIILTEAFASTAELSYRRNNYLKLRTLFQEKIQDNIIDEAFFVLTNGKIIVHSSKSIAKRLKGNIVNDELAYNIDLILLPLKRNIWGTRFLDYHIMEKRIPFKRDLTRLIKRYLYKKIDIVGWLITRAVVVKSKAVGSMNLIISKDRIYTFLLQHINKCKQLSIFFLVASIALSSLISIIIYIRDRGLMRGRAEEYIIDLESAQVPAPFRGESIGIVKKRSKIIAKRLNERELLNVNKIIKDAIPITKM